MEYLLKVSAVITIFYVCYKIFLQRDTFFNQNRAFLILGIFTAFALPFLVIPIYAEYTPVDITNYDPLLITANENIQASFSIFNYLPTIYLLGVACFSIRFLIQLTALGIVLFKSKKEKHGKYTYIKTHKDQSPFSFFNWIIFTPNSFNDSELEQIIIHEKIHANQKHSIDVLIAQLSCIALWFNPFIWFYTKALKQNLEFIADHETQHRIDCKKSYQTTLLKTSLPSHQMALTNNFHTSLIKKRIVMLHKSKSKNINLFKYVFVVPFLLAFSISCNSEIQDKEEELTSESQINAGTTNKEHKIEMNNKSLINKAKTITSEKGSLITYDSNAILKIKNNEILMFIDGKKTTLKEVESLNPKNIERFNVLKGITATKKYGNKGKNGVIEITTKNGKLVL
ncbi:M56 family metallopeptidase [Algibacter pacificus]|uniref:M56 family metallopeptidase n=1 Tax=Algibacter pacificus TaxID=2599389 RepID=UPI0011CAA0B1|nr:M56 family metallopeptidase [Algibacter pacificus]